MALLRKDNSVSYTFTRKHKNLRELQLYLNNMIQQQSQGCQNCKRKVPCDEHSCMVPYELEFKFHPQNSLINRNAFRCVGVNNSSDELVALCLECSEFLTNIDNKVAKSFVNLWPSFVWNLLSDNKVLDLSMNVKYFPELQLTPHQQFSLILPPTFMT